MTRLVNQPKPSPHLSYLMNAVTDNDYRLGYFKDIYDLPYDYPDLAYKLEAQEWIALLEHSWKFVYRSAMEDGHLSENERMDLNNIHKLRNFYSAQLRSGRKLVMHHSFAKQTYKVKELDYENVVKLEKDLTLKYNPEPEKSINNVKSPYYVPKPWEVMNPKLRPEGY